MFKTEPKIDMRELWYYVVTCVIYHEQDVAKLATLCMRWSSHHMLFFSLEQTGLQNW